LQIVTDGHAVRLSDTRHYIRAYLKDTAIAEVQKSYRSLRLVDSLHAYLQGATLHTCPSYARYAPDLCLEVSSWRLHGSISHRYGAPTDISDEPAIRARLDKML